MPQTKALHQPGFSPLSESGFAAWPVVFFTEVEKMAGDWIKMRHDLADDPAVIALTALRGVEDAEHAVGKLHKLWSWADRQTKNGVANGVTTEWLDDFVSVENFSETMQKQGWLRVTDHGVVLPRFNRHNTETAKKRALAAIRQSRKRSRDRHAAGVTKALPEKRREEKTSYDGRTDVTCGRRDLEIDWSQVDDLLRPMVAKIEKIRGSMPQGAFREKIGKAAACVVAGVLPENWLAEAVADFVAGEPKRSPAGWLGKVLAATAKERGVDFDSFQRAITIPEKT